MRFELPLPLPDGGAVNALAHEYAWHNGRNSEAIAVIGGLLSSTVLTLVVVPALFVFYVLQLLMGSWMGWPVEQWLFMNPIGGGHWKPWQPLSAMLFNSSPISALLDGVSALPVSSSTFSSCAAVVASGSGVSSASLTGGPSDCSGEFMTSRMVQPARSTSS